MANIQRRRHNPLKEAANASILAEKFPSQVLAEEYAELLQAAKDRNNLKVWAEVLRDLSDRIHGRPAQVIVNESTDVRDVIDAVRSAAAELGLVELIDGPVEVVVEASSSTSEHAGQGGVPENMLAVGQLSTDSGAAGVPRVEELDTSDSGWGKSGEVVLDSEGM